MASFINLYFEDIRHSIQREKEFNVKYNLQSTRVDYSKLKRFLTTALRRFHEIDQQFLSGLLNKLHQDVESLFDFAHSFRIKTNLMENVFKNDFLLSIPEYSDLHEKMQDVLRFKVKYDQECIEIEEKLKKTKNSLYNADDKAEYRRLKLALGDASHNFALAKAEHDACLDKMYCIKDATHNIFLTVFERERNERIKQLMKYANVKAFYLDKLLWAKASDSIMIKFYLATSGIEGDYDTKTFIKYYLKNINTQSAADKEWHLYLEQVMRML